MGRYHKVHISNCALSLLPLPQTVNKNRCTITAQPVFSRCLFVRPNRISFPPPLPPGNSINQNLSSIIRMALLCVPSLPLFVLLLVASFAQCSPNPKPLFGVGFGRKQSAGAEGTLTCAGEPLADVKVKLYDDDRGVDTDDLMGETRTDSKGRFRVEGFTHEFTSIDPKINIYHDCNDGMKPCQRKISIMIPDKYIASGEHPKTYYDAGTIELEGKFSGEKRDCIH